MIVFIAVAIWYFNYGRYPSYTLSQWNIPVTKNNSKLIISENNRDSFGDGIVVSVFNVNNDKLTIMHSEFINNSFITSINDIQFFDQYSELVKQLSEDKNVNFSEYLNDDNSFKYNYLTKVNDTHRLYVLFDFHNNRLILIESYT